MTRSGQRQKSQRVIVCIEDDFSFSDFIALFLEREGFKVTCVGTGIDAIRAIEDLCPDLVILDLMLPDLHGWEIIAQMRSQTALRTIPVIVITALSSEADRTFGQEVAGVSAYFTKPVSLVALRCAIAEALEDD